MNSAKYPSNYEIKEILSHITNRTWLNEFAQDRGVFIANVTQEELASELANLFYDDEDLEAIRSEAYEVVHSHTLTAFVIGSNNPSFDMSVTYENIRLNEKLEKGVKLDPLRKLHKKGEDPLYKGSIEYTKKKPGKMEFLEDGKFSFDFYLKKVRSGFWQVEVECSKSSDIKELKKIINDNLPVDGHSIDYIDEELLNKENSILFFDQLCSSGLDSNWRFSEVEHISIKKDTLGTKVNKNEDDVLDDEETKINSAVNDALTGINKAILEGKDIRDDDFIKDCETKGFRFTAMTYQFEHISQPYIISLTAEFKGRPRVFEIEVKNVTEVVGSSATKTLGTLTLDENRLVRSLFWNNAKLVYDKLKNYRLVTQ